MHAIDAPSLLKKHLPLSEELCARISVNRDTIRCILNHQDPRMLVVVGPCSIHDPIACQDYALKLKTLATEVADVLYLVMRVYVEKPRTNLGWKGYLNDPFLNETYCIHEGIRSTRQLMIDLNTLGLPIASEILNPFSYLYFQDLLSWGAIGARTVESQPHREVAASLEFPVGMKNTTSGNINIAIDSLLFSSHPQAFIGLTEAGLIDVIHASGNPDTHLVLRGGHGTNYQKSAIQYAEALLDSHHLPHRLLIDCSHGNSSKNHASQAIVLQDILAQKTAGNTSIIGFMLESFLEAGHQPLNAHRPLRYGVSVTDSCMSWDETERLIHAAAAHLKGLTATPHHKMPLHQSVAYA